jgi:protein-S-isoprenylcysteine O-methyltransferase Ste14
MRKVLEFYATLAIPLLYLVGLYLISLGATTSYSESVRIGFLGLAFIGIGLWILSYVYLRGSFGVLPRQQERVKRGVYRYVAHPMYLGIMLTFLGLAVANESSLGIGFTVWVLLPLLGLRAKLEEKRLIGK